MSFANPYFLIALAAASAPIIIHLLTRDRVQHVAFSTLRFFAKGAKLVVRRKKFQELILLLMRVALLALLAIVFARPFFGTKVVDTRHEFGTARVIVLDVSGSMQRPGLPEALKTESTSAAGSLVEGQDEGAVITFADAPSVIVPFGGTVAAVKSAVDSVAPGYGSTNIADAIRRANELLRSVRAKQKEIGLVSDLQRGGWNYFKGDWKLGADVKLTVDAVKPTGAGSNLGIVELSAPNSLVLDKQPSSIAVRIANYSDQPRTNLDVALLLNGKQVDAQKINIRANGKVAVRFRHVFDTPGDNPGSIVVGSDPVAANNETVYFNAHTIPRIPVLLINGRPSPNPRNDAAFFIGKALAPTDASPFTVTTVPADTVSAQDVSAVTVVILANVGQIPQPAADALKALLDRGGGLFFLPGDQTKADLFNAEFGDVAPCKLRQVLQAHPSDGETAESLTQIDFTHPIFDVFAVPHHGDLSLPKFADYWETTDTQLSHVLARFGDNRPAMVEREIGKGVSVAFVSGIDDTWNDFANQSVFLPFIHQTVRYLAVQTGQQTTFASGDSLPVPDGDTLKDPAGQTVSPSTTNGGKAGYTAGAPGFYEAMDKNGQVDISFAVNGSFTESDPGIVSGDEIASAIERAPDAAVGDFDSDAAAKPENEKQNAGLWWFLLWGIMALSVAELVLGNKTHRH
jgi:hypothetical protein